MKSTRAPGPPQRLFTGSFREFYGDLLGFLTRCAHDYGDVSYFRLGASPACWSTIPI